jgi:hypothetical protein
MTIDLDSIAAVLIEETASSVCSHSFPDGAFVSNGLPWLSRAHSRRWLGNRLFFFPSTIPDRKRIAIVSSRLRQRLDLESWWIDLVRTAILRCDSESESIVVANMTSVCNVVARAAELFGRPVIRFDVPTSEALTTHAAVREWLAECLEKSVACSADGCGKTGLEICVSPELKCRNEALPDFKLSTIPLGDRLVFAAASRVEVLSCRARGNVEKLAMAHLQDPERRQIPLWIASNADGEFPGGVADLPSGWIPWIVEPLSEGTVPNERPLSQSPWPESSTASQARRWSSVATTPVSHPEDWLLHWTRAACGPWPGETEADFIDCLILRLESADRTVLATLLKIVREKKIIASSQGIRGGYAVVSFTEVPLTEFRSRRVFRKHRNRFDFEPWGIAVRREQLWQIGVRPVIYGNDTVWQQLAPVDRPFFQKATDGGATSNVAEREQRTVNDVDLRQFPRDSVCIFVENSVAADLVSRHCEWPVIVVPGVHGDSVF